MEEVCEESFYKEKFVPLFTKIIPYLSQKFLIFLRTLDRLERVCVA